MTMYGIGAWTRRPRLLVVYAILGHGVEDHMSW